MAPLQEEAEAGAIHRAAELDVWQLEQGLLDAVSERLERTTELELVHSDGRLYVTVGGEVLEGGVERGPLLATP